jgi:hypothetical protein
MKKTITRLALSLLLVLAMSALMMPAAALAEDTGGLQVCDERYVSIEPLTGTGDPGSDMTGDGSMEHPWRTITYAISQLPFPGGNPDRINVGASDPQWYGGAVPETICVDEPVIIKSLEGAELTKIDVTNQGIPQVVEIVSSNVVLDGFFLTGAATGVDVHPPDGVDYIDNVEIINCIIKVDQVTEGIGIIMQNVKYPDIINNNIDVGVEGEGLALSVEKSWGIVMYDCFTAEVLQNDLAIHGDVEATGIEMEKCPKSVVDQNMVRVLGSGDVRATGIKIKDSPLIDVTNNTVIVEANGNSFSKAKGIVVKQSDKADIKTNSVTVDANLIGNEYGLMFARGIEVKGSSEAVVEDNEVNATADGNVNDNGTLVTELLPEEDEDLSDLEDILMQTNGSAAVMNGGFGSSIGIRVKYGDSVKVGMNEVNALVNLDGVATEEQSDSGHVAGVAIGIQSCASPGLWTIHNVVDANANVRLWVTDMDGDASNTMPDAFGMGCSTAIGIILVGASGNVIDNDVQAQGNLLASIRSLVDSMTANLDEDSVIYNLSSDMMGSIYQGLVEIIESDAVNAQLTGSVPSIESMAIGGGMATGIGIELLHSNGSVVSSNSPVSGTGNVTVTVYAGEPVEEEEAKAMGGGLGIGIGIACIQSCPVMVEDNMEVSGIGMADVDVEAVHDEAEVGIESACANGGGAGIGIGILFNGMRQNIGELEDTTGEHYWEPGPIAMGNEVMAKGIANPVNVSATDTFISHEAYAMGHAMGVGLGIASLFNPNTRIISNMVHAYGDAMVSTYSEAIHEYDPMSVGGAVGAGIGITTMFCPGSQIVDNESIGEGTADADVDAQENAVITDANAFAGSMGVGKGILVFHSDCSLVSANSVATGLGDANTDVTATSDIPLGSATTMSLATGMGTGIAVLCSARTDVVECNTAAGEGTARVVSSTNADFSNYNDLGVAEDTDILVALLPMRHVSEEDEASDEWRHTFFGRVNYNSMVDASPLGTNEGPIWEMDAGLLKIGMPYLNAKYNWWNHHTGPSGEGPGMGEPVLWIGCPVCYVPWLYVEHTEVLEEQLGKFGFYIHMCKGLNTLSTPIALEETVVPSRTWEDIATNSNLIGKVKYVDKWVPGTGWVGVTPSDTLDPLDAWYIYLFDDCNSVILMVNVDDGHPYAMPTRTLAEGWNLIGPNPIFDEPGMWVDEALKSIELTSGGLPGYAQVVSPVVRCQESWHYVPGMEPEYMNSGDGYWVWMENADTLVGFGFTPLPDKP